SAVVPVPGTSDSGPRAASRSIDSPSALSACRSHYHRIVQAVARDRAGRPARGSRLRATKKGPRKGAWRRGGQAALLSLPGLGGEVVEVAALAQRVVDRAGARGGGGLAGQRLGGGGEEVADVVPEGGDHADGGDGDERHHDDVLGHALAVFPAPKASFPAEDQLLHGGSPFAPPMVAGSAEDRPSVDLRTLTYGPRRLEPSLRSSVHFNKDRGPERVRDKDLSALSGRHNARGIVLADHGMLDEAVKEFRKAIELDPEAAHAYDNLGTVLAEKQLYREALSCYLTAIR